MDANPDYEDVGSCAAPAHTCFSAHHVKTLMADEDNNNPRPDLSPQAEDVDELGGRR